MGQKNKKKKHKEYFENVQNKHYIDIKNIQRERKKKRKHAHTIYDSRKNKT